MVIFYGNAEGRPNVAAKFPTDETLENTLTIFRTLNKRSGHLGIILKEPFVLQILKKQTSNRIELLDSSVPAADFYEEADDFLVEELIIAAADGRDVFQVARQKISVWENLKMAKSKP
jgi:ATP-dependent RNA circularization protein (DNA/RNA ligase family)